MQVQGNNTHKVTNLGCEGVTFLAGRFDATDFTHFHIDIWTETPTLDKVFVVKFSNWNGGTAEANAIDYSVNNGNFLTNPNPGTWISVDVPLADFAPMGGSRNDITQFIITSDLGTVYYDNLYLHKNTLGTSDFTVANVKVYPNPSQNEWNISANENITSIQLFDIVGKQVKAIQPNAENAVINGSELSNGVYFANIATTNGNKTVKLVKN